MEAEVRMMAAMFLAALYSIALSGISLCRYFFGNASDAREAAAWFTLSVISAAVLGTSFNHSRVREVGFTYMNALIARGHPEVQSASGGDDDD